MTDAIKTFDRTPPKKPKSFRLGGDLFHAVSAAPGGLILEFGGMTSLTDEQEATLSDAEKQAIGAKSLQAVSNFFDTVIVPNDLARWHDAIGTIGSDGSVVELPQLVEIAQWLAGEYSENPTGGSSAPTSPSGAAVPASLAGRPSEGTTFARRTPRKPSR